MKFIVSRTSAESAQYAKEPPCEGAILTMVESWDVRTFKSPEEHDESLSKYPRFVPWFEKGAEHKVLLDEDGEPCGIARRWDDKPAWEIEIADLDALLKFAEEYGELIVGPHRFDARPEIEIYDDYRE
jgi:hypothetical protein